MTEITILDGGMGQELVKRHEGEITPLWGSAVMLEQPEIVVDIHCEYIEAGADVITINAYTATPERLKRDGEIESFQKLQQASVSLAQKAKDKCGKDIKIAGSLPPLVGSYVAEVAQDFDTSLASYRRIVEQQADGVDLFICETMASIPEARAAVTAAMETGKPVWNSWTINDDDTATIRSGEPLSKAIDELANSGIDGTLINCSKPEAINSAWSVLSTATGPIGTYANGFTSIASLKPGGTVDSLTSRHDLGPEAYADFCQQWIKDGAAIIGGCCEVGPAHIAELKRRFG